MNKIIYTYLFSILAQIFTYEIQAEGSNNRLKGFQVFQDSAQMDLVGYHNCNMETNGECKIIQTANKGDLIFDIGANVGEWSLRLFSHEPRVKVYAFEPVPMLFDVLKANLQNRPVVLNQLALADIKGEMQFVYYPQQSGLSTLYRRKEVEKELHLKSITLNVKTERLDAFCKERKINHINLVKIDTEGAEWVVLKGAEGLLKKKAIDMIQFEYGGCYLDAKTSLRQIYDYLTGYGYTIYRIIPEGLIEISTWRPQLENYSYCNYLAVKKDI